MSPAPTTTIFPKVPLTLAQLKAHGRWWWFCDDATMKDIQPVLVSFEDKYDSESPCYFRHPWGIANARWESDKEIPAGTGDFRYVKNWQECFHGPCLYALAIGMSLECELS